MGMIGESGRSAASEHDWAQPARGWELVQAHAVPEIWQAGRSSHWDVAL